MRWIVMALLMAAAACGGGEMAPPVSVSGSYTLRSVNGQALPYTYPEATGLEHLVTSGSITFTGNTAAFTQMLREHRFAPNPEQSVDLAPMTVTMTVTRAGNQFTITASDYVIPIPTLSVSSDGTRVQLLFATGYVFEGPMATFVFER